LNGCAIGILPAMSKPRMQRYGRRDMPRRTEAGPDGETLPARLRSVAEWHPDAGVCNALRAAADEFEAAATVFRASPMSVPAAKRYMLAWIRGSRLYIDANTGAQ